MAVQKYKCDYEILTQKQLAKWKCIPPAIVSDCMNRSNVMSSRISPLSPGMRLLGQARTVTSMVGDNGAAHAAIGMVNGGEILVIDGKSHLDTAIWGGIMTRAALKQNIGGVIVDGAIRDASEIRQLNFPVFAAGIVPAGPSKGFGGVIDGPISCGGCPVMPGDIICGDDDGVAVIPLKRQSDLLHASLEAIKTEENINSDTDLGNLPFSQFDIEVEILK